eukprot:6707044-Alexandrium_andersonii.AAC.1
MSPVPSNYPRLPARGCGATKRPGLLAASANGVASGMTHSAVFQKLSTLLGRCSIAGACRSTIAVCA